MNSWDAYFSGMIDYVSGKSKDRSTKVGCVIVGPDNEIRSTGFNGFPRGVNDDVEARHERPAKYLYTQHAERNAIYNAARVGIPLKGSRIYLGVLPCSDCAGAIIQAGIIEIRTRKLEMHARWGDSIAVGLEMLAEAGVTITEIGGPQ